MPHVVQISGSPGGESHLFLSENSGVLVDSGFAFGAGKSVAALRQALAGRRLEYILLSHSHYDHAGGSAVIREHFPAARVAASRHAKEILEKDSARKTMRALDEMAARNAGAPVDNESIDRLSVDLVVSESDVVRVDGMSIRVIDSPGHTRCSLSFHFLEEDVLAASETAGVAPRFPKVSSAFVNSYSMALDSIDRLARIRAKHVLVPHLGVISGDDAATYFARARQAAEHTADFVLDQYRLGKSETEILDAFRLAFYDDEVASIQPEAAFIINAKALIPRLISEMHSGPAERGREVG